MLAGCQGNPDPPPLESTSPSPSPSPTASPTSSAPTLPPEAEGTSTAAAKAFVRHYVDVINYAMATGDVRLLRALSDSRCKSCVAVVSNIRTLYRSGGFLEGEGWELTQLGVLESTRDGVTIVQTGVIVAQQSRYESAETKPQHFEGGQQAMTFRVANHDSAWVVLGWTQTT